MPQLTQADSMPGGTSYGSIHLSPLGKIVKRVGQKSKKEKKKIKKKEKSDTGQFHRYLGMLGCYNVCGPLLIRNALDTMLMLITVMC